MTIEASAEAAGFERSSYFGWMKRGDAGEEPFSTFSTFAREARKAWEDEILARATATITDSLAEATGLLRAVIADSKASYKDRIRAAEALLDRGGVPKVERKEVTGEAGAPLQLAHLTSEELIEIVAAGRKAR